MDKEDLNGNRIYGNLEDKAEPEMEETSNSNAYGQKPKNQKI
jgi:hypothetical protein